ANPCYEKTTRAVRDFGGLANVESFPMPVRKSRIGGAWGSNLLVFDPIPPQKSRFKCWRQSHDILVLQLSITINNVLSDSASVGWVNMPSRKAVYGRWPIIANWSIDMISPPSMPKITAPRI